jgi:hypothetical protein
VLAATYLGRVTGYPGVKIDAALIELPDHTLLELLKYQTGGGSGKAQPPASAGSMHICLRTADIQIAWNAAIACGAVPVSDMPVEIDKGPNAGAKAAYLRIHDEITLELFEPTMRSHHDCS